MTGCLADGGVWGREELGTRERQGDRGGHRRRWRWWWGSGFVRELKTMISYFLLWLFN